MRRINIVRVLILMLPLGLTLGVVWGCIAIRTPPLGDPLLWIVGGGSGLCFAVIFCVVFFMVQNGHWSWFAEESPTPPADLANDERFNAACDKMLEAYRSGDIRKVKDIGRRELSTPAEFKEAWGRIKNSKRINGGTAMVDEANSLMEMEADLSLRELEKRERLLKIVRGKHKFVWINV